MKRLFHALSAVSLLLLSCHCLYAQREDEGSVRRIEAGGLFSPKGSGFTMFIPMKDGGAGEIRFMADFESVLIDHEARPGTRVQLLRHFVLKEIKAAEDLSIHIIGGPGISAGLVRDHGKEAGYLMALSLGGGADLQFKSVPISVFAGLSADIGAHLVIRNRYDNTMTFYQNGWCRAWYPELSVKYRF